MLVLFYPECMGGTIRTPSYFWTYLLTALSLQVYPRQTACKPCRTSPCAESVFVSSGVLQPMELHAEAAD